MSLEGTIFDRHYQRVSCILAIIFFIIFARLFHLQIYLGNELQIRAQKNCIRTTKTPCIRGNILDCNGKLLATNRPVTKLYWQSSHNKNLSADQLDLLSFLKKVCDINETETLHEKIQYAKKYGKKVLLDSDISFEHLSKIFEKFPDHPNIMIEKEIKRYYPYTMLASHTIGYISNIALDTEGKMGLEKLFETTLKGTKGQRINLINSTGSSIFEQEIKKSLIGNDIQTTLDVSLQMIAEQSFNNNQTGAMILIDPENGAIKALVSRPSFDPSVFLSPINSDKWLALQENKPFLNRVFNACYPPASIFKLVSLAAGLELNIISPETIFECNGYLKFHNLRYHCAKRSGHGFLTMHEAVAKSCNIPFYEIGKQISIDDLATYALKFGLGQKTNTVFAEQAGLVPTREWKYKKLGEPWWAGETLHASIGQGYLLVTPIQIASMIGSIFKGYLVNPRILTQEPIFLRPLSVSLSTRNFLKKSMKSVVTQGTGARVNTIEDIKIYAKTGTAQVSKLGKRSLGKEHLEHAWFVAYICFKEAPPLVLVLLIEHAGSSRAATSVAKQFLSRYRTHMIKQEKSKKS
ncbi:MAG: penicillin-binding protein 2 [Candidatus Babeliales bacterium]